MSFKEIGRKLQLAREEKGMSQEQLARALGCSQSALSNYEKGKRRLYLSHLEKLSQILDKPLEY
jgi:transcriptional regulator with XRE-family HTH domain